MVVLKAICWAIIFYFGHDILYNHTAQYLQYFNFLLHRNCAVEKTRLKDHQRGRQGRKRRSHLHLFDRQCRLKIAKARRGPTWMIRKAKVCRGPKK